jgi:hypothetical protein
MLTEKSPVFTPSVKFSLQNFNQITAKPEEKPNQIPTPAVSLLQKNFLLVG